MEALTVPLVLAGVMLALALHTIWRSAVHSRRAKVLWSFIAVVPVLGPLAWFAAGSQRRKHR